MKKINLFNLSLLLLVAGLFTACVQEETEEETFTFIDIPMPIVFQILECNRTWSLENSTVATPAKNVSIQIFEFARTEGTKNIYNLVGTTDPTGEDGVTFFAPDEKYDGKELYYSISSGDVRNTYNGYEITGLFTSQLDLDAYPAYVADIINQHRLGGLILKDMNGDGVINPLDKQAAVVLPRSITSLVTIYIASENF